MFIRKLDAMALPSPGGAIDLLKVYVDNEQY
jgi:hypothetical protein